MMRVVLNEDGDYVRVSGDDGEPVEVVALNLLRRIAVALEEDGPVPSMLHDIAFDLDWTNEHSTANAVLAALRDGKE